MLEIMTILSFVLLTLILTLSWLMCHKTCYLLKWIHVISDVKIHVKELDPLYLTCNLSGSNITWNYRGKISFGRVRRLESIMRSASGVYRCNNSTSGENYTVIEECDWKLIHVHPCVLSLYLISLNLFSVLIVLLSLGKNRWCWGNNFRQCYHSQSWGNLKYSL